MTSNAIDAFLDNDVRLMQAGLILAAFSTLVLLYFWLRVPIQVRYLSRFAMWCEVRYSKGVLIQIDPEKIETDICHVDKEYATLPLGGHGVFRFYHVTSPVRLWCNDHLGYIPVVVPRMVWGEKRSSMIRFRTPEDAISFKFRWG